MRKTGHTLEHIHAKIEQQDRTSRIVIERHGRSSSIKGYATIS